METSAVTLLDHVTTGLGTVVSWAGTVVDSLVGADGALKTLAPLFAIGIAISAFLLGVKVIKSLVWGS